MLEQLLNTILRAAAGVSGQRRQQQAQDTTEADATKTLRAAATKAAEEGDWEWMYDNQEAITQRFHPHVIQSLLSTTTLNNARRYDAEVAEGGRPTIPLSPKNIYIRGAQQKYSIDNRPPEQSVLQANSGPMNGEIGGFAQPGFPTSGGGGQAPDAQTGVSNYQAPGIVGTHPRGIAQDVTPADMSTARQPVRQPLAPQGSAEYEAQHAARRVPTGNFTQLDQALGGEFSKGNISLNNRPVQWHKNGKDYSSLESMSFNENGKEVLIPQVVNGKLLSEDAAIEHYRRTGEHLGKFNTPEEATQHAIALERRQQAYYENGPGKGLLKNGAQEITLPTPRRPSSMTRDFGSTKITTTNPVMTGKEAMASMAAQATAQNAHPDKLLQDFHSQNAQLKHPYDFDEVGFHEYRTQYWERSRKQIQDLLIANGATQDDAMRQSATMTYNKTGYVPSQWTGMVTPSAESVSNNAYHTVLKQANTQLSSVLQGLAAPLQSVKPSAILNDTFAQPFLLKAVDSIPGMELNPAARTSVLHSLASTAHSAFLSAVQQHTHGLNSAQQNYFAMSMASKAVGGNVPEQWRAFVENDLEKLGLVSREDMQYFQHMPPNQRPDIFAPDFGQRIGNFRAAVENSADYRKAMQQMAKSPETLAAVQQMFAGQKTGKDAITPATIGKQERNIAVQQHGALKQEEADRTRTNAIIPHEMLKDLQIADGIYQAGREAQKFAQAKDKNGQTIIDKYGDTPGSWREFSQSIQAGFGRSDKHLVAYLNRLAKVYNFERHELTGAATSVFEGSSLKHYIPNPDDNVRTGLRKLNTLVESLGGQLDKKLDQAQADYPRSAHEKFYRNQERAKQKQDTELDDIFTEAKKRRKP